MLLTTKSSYLVAVEIFRLSIPSWVSFGISSFLAVAHFILVLKFMCIESITDYDSFNSYPLNVCSVGTDTRFFISNSLVIFVFDLFFFVNLARVFPILLIFQRSQLLVSFIFFIVFMFSISFISAFIIFFFLLAWV